MDRIDRIHPLTVHQDTTPLAVKKVTVSHIHLSYKTDHDTREKFCNQNLQLPFKLKMFS